MIGRPFGKLILLTLVAGLFSLQADAQSAIPDPLQQLQQMQGQQGSSNGGGQSVPQQTTILVPNSPQNPQLPTSRLEQILSARAGVALKQFGYDQLGVGRAISISQMGAVQDDYVLGPGDEIVVSLRGQENAEYRAVVDRDARVVLPRMNPISVGGRTFGDFRRDLTAAIHRSYIATEGFVSVGRLRQISVLVSGEVNSPGVRTLTGLSTPADAILISGGVKKTGSLRNVYILRGARRISIDLYSVLTGHGEASHAALADGDRIVVPPLGPTVAVAGWVRRPGIYEIAGGRASTNVRELLSLAGGLEVRGKYHLSLLRVAADGRNQMVTLESQSGAVGDSDILFVRPAADQTVNSATLSGGTALAGKFSVRNTKLSEILKSPGALGSDPYTLMGIISRRDPVTLLRTLIAFTPVAVLKGSEDMDVQSDDNVRVLSAKEARLMFATIRRYEDLRQNSEEALRDPQALAMQQQMSAQGNGAQQNNATPQTPQPQYGNQQFQGTAPNNTAGTNSQNSGSAAAAQYLVLPPSPDMAARQALLQAEDDQFGPGMLQSQTPNYESSSQARQQAQPTNQAQSPYPAQPVGQASNPYQAQNPTDSQYSNQLQALYGQQPSNTAAQQPPQPDLDADSSVAGQTGSGRDVGRLSQLAAQLHVDPLLLVDFLQDHAVNVDGAVREAGLYFVGPDADLQSLLLAAGGMENWANKGTIEVISTNVNSSTGAAQTQRKTVSLADAAGADYVVSPHDEVRVSKVFTDVGIGSVKLQGQFRQVGTYQIVRGEHLSDVLMRAGGLTDNAYPYGTVLLRRSAAERERDSFRREAAEINDQLLVAMSRRDPLAKLSPDAFTAVQSFVNDLKNQPALGRVSVTADPTALAANPSLDPLLEPGDVIFVPQRPYEVSVLGQVLQPGSVPFRPGMSASDYIDQAGGYSQFADKSETFIVLPDGSARQVERSWLDFGGNEIPPGSTIFVSRDISGVDWHQIVVDTASVFGQLATSAAALAVLSKQ